MIKFIYFDLGGVLFSEENIFGNVSKIFEKKREDFLKIFRKNHEDLIKGKIDSKKFWRIITRELKIYDGCDFEFFASWIKDYSPIKDAHFLVKTIAKRHRVGILTNIYKGMTFRLIEKKIIPKIEYVKIISSCDTGIAKPDMKIYKIAEGACGAKPEEILLVDDEQKNLAPAKKRGWQTVLFNAKNPSESSTKVINKLKIGAGT